MQANINLESLAARVEKLEKAVFAKTVEKTEATARTATGTKPERIDFSVPIRAFTKKHCLGMSGAKKFTLVLAYLSKGDSAKKVPLSDIEDNWNRMTSKSLLGM